MFSVCDTIAPSNFIRNSSECFFWLSEYLLHLKESLAKIHLVLQIICFESIQNLLLLSSLTHIGCRLRI